MSHDIIIFGATGSVGNSACNVIRRHRSRFNIIGITGHKNIDKLASIAREFGVKNVGIFDKKYLNGKEHLFDISTRFFFGEIGFCELASCKDADSILMAIVGTGGLRATISAIESKKTIFLASKEILVVAGKFVIENARRNSARILPIDSEHNAIFQCLAGHDKKFVDKLILTASGGPLRNFSLEELCNVSISDVLSHPIWSMGKKITVDSATLANKALEVIEARWLFDIPASQIEVIVHPESIIHSMVQFTDGSIISQMCPPNMEFPISHCLFFPDRENMESETVHFQKRLDLVKQSNLTFFAPDTRKFPILELAYQCLSSKTNASSVFHAANEIAVENFLNRKIKFLQIYEIVSETLNRYAGEYMDDIESCIRSVEHGRAVAIEICNNL